MSRPKPINIYSVQLFTIIVLLLSTTQIVYADQTTETELQKEWQKLNQLAEESLFLFEKKEYEASRKVLNQLSMKFLDMEPAQYLDHIEKVRVVLDTIVQAKEALSPITLNEEKIKKAQNKLVRMRVTLDAVSHKRQPLWLTYYPKMMETISDIQTALEKGERDPFYYLINQLHQQYELVRPAIYVSHPLGTAEQIDSLFTFIENNKGSLWEDKDKGTQTFKNLENLLKMAFFKKEKVAPQSLYLILLGIGTLIFSVLSYVAWKKYKGEFEQKTVAWKKSR